MESPIMKPGPALLRALILGTLIVVSGAGTTQSSGTVTGEVLYAGPVVEAATIRVTRDAGVCGISRAAEDLVVVDGKLANVVIVLEPPGAPHEAAESPAGAAGQARGAAGSGIGARAPAPSGPHPAAAALDLKECRFSPRVLVLPVGGRLRILNADGVLHAVQVAGASTRVDVALGPGATEAMVPLAGKFERPEVLAVRCTVHPWMTAFVVLTGSRYAAVTDQAGRFTLDHVPPGRYTLSLWHQRLGLASEPIEVEAGTTTQLMLDMTGPAPTAPR
jgi:hypothetical protein